MEYQKSDWVIYLHQNKAVYVIAKPVGKEEEAKRLYHNISEAIPKLLVNNGAQFLASGAHEYLDQLKEQAVLDGALPAPVLDSSSPHLIIWNEGQAENAHRLFHKSYKCTAQEIDITIQTLK